MVTDLKTGAEAVAGRGDSSLQTIPSALPTTSWQDAHGTQPVEQGLGGLFRCGCSGIDA